MSNTATINKTDFNFKNQTAFYRGKVRDVYSIGNDYMVLIASDRISAFDCILPEPIPYKGAILTTIAAHFLELTKDIVPNWLLKSPEPRVAIGYKCEALPIEMVIRGFLCGHALREYNLGKRMLCGVPMPDGMLPYQAFAEPIITPSTKAQEGHDEDISKEDIIAQGIVSKEVYEKLETYTRNLYKAGNDYAAKQGLILADTKYEFGIRNGKIMLIDEIHTPDSSRYFYKNGFDGFVRDGITPKQLSKEFVREWLMENGFQGKDGQQMPDMSPDVVASISKRYSELFKNIMGYEFSPNGIAPQEALQVIIENALEEL
ncbi:MAG: phosphoribosylaminoimidazolesuccinocarboxamide synthase [Bacteroidetes bacterium]|nr:phosphoribosylaminoimidazolesuccinocarboxamide synthase [Bacteroidota bacterium]